MTKKGKAARSRGKSVTSISRAERVKIVNRLTKRYERLREKYPEVHGKVVDFVSNSVDDGTLYFTAPVDGNQGRGLGIHQCRN